MGHASDPGRRVVAETGPSAVVRVPTAGVMLEAELTVPETPRGLVLIAPAVGGARRRPHLRTTLVRLCGAGWATVLLELMTPREEYLDETTTQRRLDVGLLSGRVAGALEWLRDRPDLTGLPVGLLGAGRGAAAALLTAARRPDSVHALVSRGVRPALGEGTLSLVTAPTLLITGEPEQVSGDVTRQTAERLGGRHQLHVVADADRRFLAPGPLNQVLNLASEWFAWHLTR